MHQTDESDFDSFCKNKLLEGLGPEELKALYDLTHSVKLEAGEVLFSEGDIANDLFFVTQGTLEITKHDPEIDTAHLIQTVTHGDVIGELTFIDKGTRSASVRAKTITTLRKISFPALEKHVNQSPKYAQVYIQLAKSISQRLRISSDQALDSLKREVQQNKMRVRMGNFLIYIITTLSFLAYSLDGLQYLISISPNTSYVALPFTLIIVISLGVLIVASKFSWREFGVSLSNWRQAAFEGCILSTPLMILSLLIKWFLIHFNLAYEGEPLFDPFAVILDPEQKTWLYWVALNSIYWVFLVPVQELITRGILQGMLENFLSGKYKIALSIVMSNLIFSAGHLFFSLEIGLFTLVGGIYIGWIYSRTHNLIGSIIAHILLGTWLLSIMGIALSVQKA
jgi:CRP-like cAMP-binding protein